MANNTYISGKAPASNILKSTFVSRLSSLFGYRAKKVTPATMDKFPDKYGMEFVKVDLNDPAYRFKDAALGSVFQSQSLAQPLEKYFNAYMEDNTISYSDIADRQKRLNELSFFAYNDDYGGRVVSLVAAEATQLDVQDRILSVESPNLNFTNKCYELFSRWGITQQRLYGVCADLEEYGESFWAQKIGDNGVEKITPINPNIVLERLEFSPMHMADYLAQRDGYMQANKNRKEKIATLIDLINSEKTMDYNENFADMFDTKLLGYELQDGQICPPWCMTHFRFNAEGSEFFPYGRPPLINCLAPFKQCYSTMMLQGLARSMSFPITMYKVKGTEGMGPEVAFEHVNNVREEYDNIGVTADTAGGEVYTVNTKMWLPDGLLDIDVKESKCDIDFVGDLELYQDRVAIAAGVPKAYLDQEFGGFGNSGISLTEQYKPFARHVYTIQSSCLEGIGELIRLHFAITGEFDYNTPFVLSMRFPAEEMGQEKRDARTASIEMSKSIVELITQALGLEDGEPLPEDVITDILSKYSFLDPTDVQKWMRLSATLKPVAANDEDAGGGDDSGDDFGGGDFGGGGDLGGGDDMAPPADDGGGDAGAAAGGDDMAMPEAKRILQNRKERLFELKQKRFLEVRKHYNETKEDIFFHFIESNHMQEFQNTTNKRHCLYIPKLTENSPSYEALQVIRKGSTVEKHLQECGYYDSEIEGVQEKLNEAQYNATTDDEIEAQNKMEQDINDALGLDI